MKAKERIVIFGAGWLGRKLAESLEAILVSRAMVDLTKSEEIQKFIDYSLPTVVINTAGKTGRPNIDWCEDHKKETFDSNVHATLNLARVCLDKHIYFVHLGSGCIYDGYNGGNGYTEEDEPNFYGSTYSISKIISERELKSMFIHHDKTGLPQYLGIRIRNPVDSQPDPNKRNYIDKIIGYPKVIDAANSVTIIPDMLPVAKQLIAGRATGIYNLVNPGLTSPAEIVMLYTRLVDPTHKFEVISANDLHKFTKAKRSNCSLNTDKLKKFGIVLPDVQVSLERCLKEYQEAKVQEIFKE